MLGNKISQYLAAPAPNHFSGKSGMQGPL